MRLRPGQSLEHANAALRAAQPRIREATTGSSVEGGAFSGAISRLRFTLAPAATGNSRLRSGLRRRSSRWSWRWRSCCSSRARTSPA